jgi:hypothetical protein
MLTLTPRLLITYCCVLLLQLLCRMRKLIGGVKQAFSFGPSSWGLAHALVMDHKTPHGLHPSCLHCMRPGDRSAILHTMTLLWPQTVMTFPSVAPRRWGCTSLFASESLVTHMYTLWTSSRGMEWMKSFPSSSGLLVGQNSTEGIRQLERWMDDFATVQTEMQASTHRPAWCTTSSVTSGLTLMHKSYKDLSLGEMSGAQVWVLACLVPFPAFPVIVSLVTLVVPLQLSWLLEWIASSS